MSEQLYLPGLGKVVDPSSLTLSLQSESDERIQLARRRLGEIALTDHASQRVF